VKKNLIADVIAEPTRIARYTLSDWDLLVRQARNSDLLARLFVHLQKHSLADQIPAVALKHFVSAHTQTKRHAELVNYEVSQIYAALSELETPIVLLKGAAYIAAGLDAGNGRIFTDVDAMVAKEEIDLAEDALQHAGWASTHLDEYDQKYYRKWMHELPPMKHTRRKSVLDLHHAILPETARLKPEATKLFAAINPVEEFEFLYTLCPEDMILHSATHLFSDGEFEHGLRDLIDIDSLIKEFSSDKAFWQSLIDRAKELDLTRPLFYALHYCKSILKTPVPDSALLSAKANAAQSSLIFRMMNWLLSNGLQPNHASCQTRLSGFKSWVLYVRSHYLRMPFRLLIPHLTHKSIITPWKEWKKAREAAKRPTIQQLLAKKNIQK
jgi:hypothetical protein